jgi:hypothetical protein
MSYLAIGSVTKAIAELLSKKMNRPPLLGGSTPKVTTLPPDDDRVNQNDGVNLFLYRVSANPFVNNMDWRGDRSNPNGSRRAPLSLTLHYLLTAYAKKADAAAMDDVTAHHLLGNAMAILHEYPVLNEIRDSDFDAGQDTQFAAELRNSFEKIKLSLVPTTMEELSKIWTGVSKAYRLSVAYDVSLVQIAPIAPAAPPAPPVQGVSIGVATRGAPFIESLVPAAGASGTRVSIKGSDLKAAGSATTITFGETTLAESDLVKCTRDEIVLTVPADLQRGPRVRVRVGAGGEESADALFEVRPWISSVRPLRGIDGVPLEIPYEVPAGMTVGVEFDGQVVNAVYDAQAKVVRSGVPSNLTTNGLKSVVLLLGDGAPQRSNARFFEVLPLVESFSLTTQDSPAQSVINVNGQRINGKDVNVRYGELLIRKGENANATQVVVTVPRVLMAGLPLSLVVDNRESNRVPPLLESVEPREAALGDVVRLRGQGLSGAAVVVRFGATDVQLGPHAFPTQLDVAVPKGLAPGEVLLKVEVNGAETNELTFTVI